MSNILKQPCDEGVILSGESETPCKKSAGPWILAATIGGSGMAFIDGTVVNVALPALQSSLNATATDVQWVVESYALFLSALLLVGGSLGDRYGRRLIYATGISIFALASAWCGLSSSVNSLIFARAMQGIGGALLVPGSLAIISSAFAEEDRGRAIGTWSGFSSITAAIGPVLGGWLIEHVSWRAAFFINLPIAVIVLVLLFRHVPESRNEENRAGLDWLGALLATIGLGALVYGLIESSDLGFAHPHVFVSLSAGALFLAIFIIVESRVRNPMLPLGLFRSKDFSGANLLTFFLYAALGGALFFYPLNLIQVQGYSATAAGAGFLPFTIIMFSLSRWSGGLVSRYGARMPLIIGPIIACVGFFLFTLPTVSHNYWTSFFPATVMLGLGMTITAAPLTTTVMNSVSRSQAGVASGISNAVARTAGLLAVAGLGAIMLHSFSHQLDEHLARVSIPEDIVQSLQGERIRLGAIKIPARADASTQQTIREAVSGSFVIAFRMVMIVASALAFASAVMAWLLIGGKETTEALRHRVRNRE